MLPVDLAARLAAALERPLGRATPLHGGSINQAFRLESASGPIFVKHHPHPPRTPSGIAFFDAEARGLALLAPHLPVPRVLAVLDDALALAWVTPAARTRESEARAGRALAALHAQRGARFGLDHDNFMGAVPQDNRPAASFTAFFRERRLAPLAHHLPPAARQRLARLPLEQLLGEPAAPTLIHGDLWGGNLLHGEGGPVFIDPAVSYGHAEQDLAMTGLFGGFSEAFYAAYREAGGLVFDRDLAARLEVLTLYPLLIHVALFGGHYLAEVDALLRRHAP